MLVGIFADTNTGPFLIVHSSWISRLEIIGVVSSDMLQW